MGFEIGNRIFDYEITGVLGAGGMGKVYKVRNVISDRVDALKVLLPDLAHQPDLADRFLREIKVLASLSHPNIAAFHTALTFENQLIMVMEFVSGITINERLQQGPMPLRESIACIDQVLAALSYAHGKGVIHRDIKPANMMLTAEGSLKLMDFGIAKAAADPHLTRTGTTVGSLFYISPEQLSGGAMDARSDLYSLGVAMYEIMTGKRPFEGKSDYSLMKAHLDEAPRPPIEMNPALSPALNSVILLALAKNPEDRFQSADAFRAALNEAARGIEGATAPVAPPAPSVKPGDARFGRAEQAAPLAPVAAQETGRGSGHRGAYMLLGALIAVVIIVASAVELPRWFRARAHSQSTPPAAMNAPQPAPPAPSQRQAATPVASEKSPTAMPNGNASLSGAVSSTVPAAATIHQRAVKSTPEASASATPTINSAQVKEQAAQSQSSSPSGSSTTAASTEPAAPDAVALQSLSDRMDQLAARANAMKSTFSSFQQQVGSTGQALRPDIVASESRMERYMDEADSALAARNAEQARHYQELADKEISNLESFFGR